MKAAVYIRVSTPGQAINGESLDMQKERLIEYVKTHKWDLYKTYEDGGFSGKDTNRPAFQEMLKDAEDKKFDILVVYKIDRLSRSILDFHTTMKFLEKQGISFVSVTQQFDTTNSMGRLMLAILVDFANFEREINVDRAIDSYMKRLQDGVNSGTVPYGYRREGKKVVIVPEEAKNIKEIFHLASQNLSMNNIARKTGFTNYHIRSILTNPFYCGYIVRKRDRYERRIKEHEWKWYKGKHKPIISEETWKETAELRKKKIKVIIKKTTGIFSRLIYCPYCEHNLCFHSKYTKDSVILYYQCDRIKMDGKSCSQYIREEPLETVLLNYINNIFELKVPISRREIEVEDKVANVDRKIDKIIKLIEEDYMSFEKGKKQLDKLKEEKAVLLASRIIETDYSEIVKKLKQIKQIYPLATREERSQLWHVLIEKIEAHKDKIVVYWRFRKKQTIQRRKISKLLKNYSPTQGRIPPAATTQANVLMFISDLKRLLTPKKFLNDSWPSKRK